MALIKLICETCESEFERQHYDVNYNAKGRGFKGVFCSTFCKKKRDKLAPFKRLLRSSVRRGKEHNLTIEELKFKWDLQKGICVYTNVQLQLVDCAKRKVPAYYAASLDRINNTKGYTKDNIQFVSIMANYAKNRGTHEEMLEFIRIIQNGRP